MSRWVSSKVPSSNSEATAPDKKPQRKPYRAPVSRGKTIQGEGFSDNHPRSEGTVSRFNNASPPPMATTSCHGRPREKRDREDSGTDIPSKNDKPAGMESGKSL